MSISNSTAGNAWTLRTAMFVAFALASTGCAAGYNTGDPAVSPAIGGPGATLMGSQEESTARTAINGAVVGGAAGALMAKQMDQQAQELMGEVSASDIVRVGEGIEITFDAGRLFDTDSNTFRRSGRKSLETLANSLKEYGNTNLLIIGHTDDRGSAEQNRNMSTLRADATYRYLATQGVEPGRMKAFGVGESEPAMSNGTHTGRRANRRIVIAIFAGETARGGLR